MEIEIKATGEIVESQELLNGTRTIAFEAASDDGVWLVSGVVSWNLGLIEYPGEGDLTLSREGAEVYATLVSAVADAEADAEDDTSDALLQLSYEIDGGAGEFDGANGGCGGSVKIAASAIEGTWVLDIGPE